MAHIASISLRLQTMAPIAHSSCCCHFPAYWTAIALSIESEVITIYQSDRDCCASDRLREVHLCIIAVNYIAVTVWTLNINYLRLPPLCCWSPINETLYTDAICHSYLLSFHIWFHAKSSSLLSASMFKTPILTKRHFKCEGRGNAYLFISSLYLSRKGGLNTRLRFQTPHNREVLHLIQPNPANIKGDKLNQIS